MTQLNELVVTAELSIQRVMETIDRAAKGIVLVVDRERHLLGTVTDGDIRRGILHGIGLEEQVEKVMNRHPFVATLGTTPEEIRGIMKTHEIKQIPIINKDRQIVDLALWQDFIAQPIARANPVIILAGGLGTRLRPLTEEIPKPLLKVGDKPILQLIIERLAQNGFHHIFVSVCYKAEMIEDYFGDGSKLGVSIEYLKEDKLTGTAGPLKLAQGKIQTPFLVMNGDLLTQVNFENLLDFHVKGSFELTVGVKNYGFQVPYGVLKLNGDRITALEEKPTQTFFVNAGIYALNPELLELIPADRYFDMTDLAEELLKQNRPVGGFPLYEYWLDIGNQETFRQANADRKKLLGAGHDLEK